MTDAPLQMHLSLSVQGAGYHYGAWRMPTAPANPDTNIDFYLELAALAERGKFDMLFLADWLAFREDHSIEGASQISGVGRLEPITTLAAIASHTKRIGLVGTISTTFSQPYQIARTVASLDHISKGRSGWNVVTSWSDEEAKNFGDEKMLEHSRRYARAREFVEVVFGLWDSWEGDAFIRDKATGRYFDPNKLHVLAHKGEHFDVRGPLNMEAPPQGRPIISQAGASHDGQELAAATADMVFALSGSLQSGQEYYGSLKDRMSKYGRHPDELKVMPGMAPIVGRSESDARAWRDALAENVSEELGLALLSPWLGDLRGLPIDKPIPDIDTRYAHIEDRRIGMINLARTGKTIRELYRMVAIRNWNAPTGMAGEVADYMEERFRHNAADGYNLLFTDVPHSARMFVDLVVPELQRRKLFRTEYSGGTLRSHLGLDRSYRHARNARQPQHA